jgi:PST family polysaccharide transporter
VIRNFFYLSGAEAVSKLVTFAAIAYLARVAGPVGFGYVEFAGSVLLCAGLLVDQGFGPYGAREIAKAPQDTTELFSEVVFARVILALAAFTAMAGFALVLDRSPLVTRLLLIDALSLLGMPLLLQWVFQGHDQMQTVAVVQLIRQTVYSVVVFASVRTADQIWLVGVAEVLGVGAAAAYGLWMYRRRFGGVVRSQLKLSKRLIREGVPIGLSQAFWMVRMYGATVLLGLIASPQDVGYFGSAMRILVALHAFIYLYYFNLLPSLSRAWHQGTGRFGAIIARSLHGVAWASAFAGIVWVLLAPIVSVGVYGAAFAPAGTTLQWLAGVGIVAALSGHYRFGLIAAGRQTAEMVSQAVGSALAVAAIPLAYAQAGPAGAAAALVAAEIVVWCCTWWWSRQKMELRGHAGLLVRPLLSGLVALALLWFMPTFALGVRIAAVVLFLAIIALLLDGGVRDYLGQVVLASRRWLRARLEKRVPETAR